MEFRILSVVNYENVEYEHRLMEVLISGLKLSVNTSVSYLVNVSDAELFILCVNGTLTSNAII